jgi:hypothetical protein
VGQPGVGTQTTEQLLRIKLHPLTELLALRVGGRVRLVSKTHTEQQVVAFYHDRLRAQPAPRHADLQPPDAPLDQTHRQMQRIQRILRRGDTRI